MPLKYIEPEGELARELRAVARDAEALENVLTQNLNIRIPDDFPKAQLVEIVRALARLPNGTAEGCLTSLEYARNRLPAIRRAHIISEEIDTSAEAEETPSLVRGELVDQRLRDLITSVTTALDEYRGASGEEFAEYEAERGIAAPRATTSDAVASSERLGQSLVEFKSTLEAVKNPASKPADTLNRQISDAHGINDLARVELKMPKVVAGWYGKAVNALKEYPDLIRKTASTLKDGADIVQIGIDRWHEFKHDGIVFFVSEFKKTCDSLSLVADKLDDLKHAKRRSMPADLDEELPPDDFDERAAVDMIINEGKMPPERWWPFMDQLRTTTRSRRGRRLKDLSPLSKFENLRCLDLHKTSAQITNFEALKNNKQLEILALRESRMRDLNWISGLTKLELLYLPGSMIANVDGLSSLTRLETLDLSGSSVVDIGGLSGLPNLETIDLSDCEITDMRPLATLPKLRTLRLNHSTAMDYSFLSDCNTLTDLCLSHATIRDFKVLSECKALTDLDLSYTSIRDLRALKGLAQLETLELNYTNVSDLTPLARLKYLGHLELNHTKIRDLKALSRLVNLGQLMIRSTRVQSVKPLAGLINLEFLDANDTLIKDFSPLAHIDMGITAADGRWSLAIAAKKS